MTMTHQLRSTDGAHNARFAPEGAACDRCTAGCSVALLCTPGGYRSGRAPESAPDKLVRMWTGCEFPAEEYENLRLAAAELEDFDADLAAITAGRSR